MTIIFINILIHTHIHLLPVLITKLNSSSFVLIAYSNIVTSFKLKMIKFIIPLWIRMWSYSTIRANSIHSMPNGIIFEKILIILYYLLMCNANSYPILTSSHYMKYTSIICFALPSLYYTPSSTTVILLIC